jgi:uracil-DNA glycosylase
VTPIDPNELEIAPGFQREELQGSVFAGASPEELREALEKAFDYRGDVTITCKDGSTIEGYVFDRHKGANLADSYVRLFPKDGPDKMAIAYGDIAGLAFTGRDTAAGKSWAAWVKKYLEKKAAGEKQIEIVPESLEE